MAHCVCGTYSRVMQTLCVCVSVWYLLHVNADILCVCVCVCGTYSMVIQKVQHRLEQLMHCWVQEEQTRRSHWGQGFLDEPAFRHTQQPAGAATPPEGTHTHTHTHTHTVRNSPTRHNK